MSSFVKFTKQGLFGFEWNGDLQEYIQEVPHPRGNIINLRSSCQIEDGVTLGDIFKAVESDPPLMDFISVYSWCGSIQEFHEQAKLPPVAPAEGNVEIKEILIEPFAELHTDWKARKKRKRLSEDQPEPLPMEFNGVWIHLTGLGVDGVHYSISYTPMNELANAPVRLVPDCKFSLDHEDFPGLGKVEYHFSLLEVLDTIYFDISFHGGPKDNADFLEDLKGMVKEIEDGTAKTTPFKFLDDEEEE